MTEIHEPLQKVPVSRVDCLHCGDPIDLTEPGTWKQEGNRAVVACPTCWGEMEARGWLPRMSLTKL